MRISTSILLLIVALSLLGSANETLSTDNPTTSRQNSAEDTKTRFRMIISGLASLLGTLLVIKTAARDFLPPGLVDGFIHSKMGHLVAFIRREVSVTVREFEGGQENSLYLDIEVYLSSKVSPTADHFRASVPPKEKDIVFTLEKSEPTLDVFQDVKFTWKKRIEEDSKSPSMEYSQYELCFKKKHRDLVLTGYLPYIKTESKRLRDSGRVVRINSLDNSQYISQKSWFSVELDHPSTFETLALDPSIKQMIKEDLDAFIKRRDFYKRVGRAWKRGYLFYGPPGTGKSSLIAAIANYLKFDIFELQLMGLTNFQLQKLLLSTSNRSILVVEDIDCGINLEQRGDSWTPTNGGNLTLSGLLNVMDGLWSSCGEERIIILTTNHKEALEALDPALLRPGRIDFHLNLSYCTSSGLKVLISNYLQVEEHPLLEEAENLICKANITPAEICEVLIRTQEVDSAMVDLLAFIKR